MQKDNQYKHLFEPIKIGTKVLRNRFVHTATVTGYGKNTAPTMKLINYHKKLAENSVAMIVTELMPVHPTSIANPFLVSAFDTKNTELFESWANEISSAGSHLIGQIGHVGRQQLWNPLSTPISASAEPDPLSWTVPREMNSDDIKNVINGFTDSAQILKKAGFAGVELHGAHGYLLTQFMSPFSNKRKDDYGGDCTKRLRIVHEISHDIRNICGDDFIIGLKMPCDEGVEGGIDLDEATEIGQLVSDTMPIDYLCFSQGNFSPSLEDHLPDMHFPDRPFQNLHAELKKRLPKLPIITVGKIESAAAAEKILSTKSADLVGYSRAFVSDPEYVSKLKNGMESTIRPCIYCNFCWGEIHAGRGMKCLHNNQLSTPHIKSSTNLPKRIVVVGGGIAGLETASNAAENSAEVILISRNKQLGGKLRWEASLPGRGIIQKEIDFQKTRLKEAGVKVKYCEGTVEEVLKLDPNHVVLACGANFSWPNHLHKNSLASNIIDSSTPFLLESHPINGTAVIFDQDHTAACYATAELLAEKFDKVIIITPKATIGSKINYISMIGVFRRLLNRGIEIIPFSVPTKYENRCLKILNPINKVETKINDVSHFTFATPKAPHINLLNPLQAHGLKCTLAGDCDSPRGLAAAISDGAKIIDHLHLS